MTDLQNRAGISRRNAIKTIGAGTAAAWAAPAIVSLSRASAANSPAPPPACVPGELVSYNSGGWKYLQVSSGGTPGFEALGFDDSGFATGTGGFGSGGGCPIQANRQTQWDVGTDMLLRRQVVVPAGATAVSVYIAIDNDLAVWWDGVSVGGGTHDGCSTPDSFVIPVPTTPGSHVLAIRGIDRGGEAYLDARVTVNCT